jgi:hypothetical protein
VSGLESDGGDEPQRAVAVREGADAARAPLHLAVQPLEAVGRADARPVLTREGEELGGGIEARLETGKRLRHLPAQSLSELVEPLARLGQLRGFEDGAQLLGDPRAKTLGCLGEDVALEVDRTALTSGLGQVATHGGGDAAVVIRDDELDATESALAQLRKQLRPALLALLGPEGYRQQPSMAGEVDP